jgi:hypothetical protein
VAVAPLTVNLFGAEKTEFYTQTVDNIAPTTIQKYALNAYVTTVAAGLATNFTVSSVATLKLVGGNDQDFGGFFFYKSLGKLNAAFPAGDAYKFTAVGGPLNGESDNLPILADAFPKLLYLTGNVLTAASNISPNAAFTLKFRTAGKGAAETYIGFLVFLNGQQVYSQYTTAGKTSLTFPQSAIDSLTPGVDYVAELESFNDQTVKTTGSFSGAKNNVGFVRDTQFPLRVK